MGFFGSGDKNQSTTNQQYGASEEAQQNIGVNATSGGSQGGYGNRNLGTDSLDISQGQGIATADGGVSLGGYANRNNLGGEYTASGNSHITINDGAALTKYGDTLTQLVEKQNAASEKSSTNTNTVLGSLVDAYGKLVESKNTGGETSRNNIVLYIALAIAAVFAIFFWKRK